MLPPHSRRGLVGLDEVGKPPTTPIDVLLAQRDGVAHAVAKRIKAQCVNGIDTWWLETTCGMRVVATAMAPKPERTTCIECVAYTTDLRF